jgi:hypothetical protein
VIRSAILAGIMHVGPGAQAQVKDTAIKHNYSEVTYYTLGQPHETYRFDSALTDFHLYPLFRATDPFAEAIGNTGMPAITPRFAWRRPLGIDAGFHAHHLYFYDHDRVPFFSPPFAFTSLEYVQGLAGEQQLRALHTQNIKGRVNVGADYRILGSRGVYDRQLTNIYNLHAHVRYRTKDRRYGVLASFLLNDVKNEANGGVIQAHRDDPDSLFSLSLKTTAMMRNTTATMRQHHKELALYQHLDFGQRVEVVVNDTITHSTLSPSVRLFHRLKWGEMLYGYEDANLDSGYYEHMYLRVDSTSDKTHHIFFHNRVGIEFPGVKSKAPDTITYSGIGAEVWIAHTLDEMRQSDTAFDFAHLWVGGAVRSREHRLPLDFLLEATAILNGDRAGDLQFTAGADRHLAQEWSAGFRFGYARQAPGFIQEYYRGNHFMWDTSLMQETHRHIDLQVRGPDRLFLEAALQAISQYVYFDSLGRPAQLNDVLRVASLELKHTFAWRQLRFHNQVLLQSSNQDSVIDIPAWSSRHALYFDGAIFSGAMSIQAGIDLRFHSTFYAPYFEPIISQFLIQRRDLVASVPVADVFVNMRIKKARAFLMLSDALEGLLAPGGYFVVPGYPAAGRTFRFGVSWQFFD